MSSSRYFSVTDLADLHEVEPETIRDLARAYGAELVSGRYVIDERIAARIADALDHPDDDEGEQDDEDDALDSEDGDDPEAA